MSNSLKVKFTEEARFSDRPPTLLDKQRALVKMPEPLTWLQRLIALWNYDTRGRVL